MVYNSTLEMKKKSILKNYIYNVVYQLLLIILPVITTPYISRVLGAKNIGIYGYTYSIVTFFALLGSVGVAYYGEREIAYVQDDKKKYSKLFWEIFFLRLITMTISLFVYGVAFIANSNDYSVFYKVLTIELISNMLDISWFFQGLEEFKKTVIRSMVVKIISVICIFLLVRTPNDLIIYIAITAVSNLLGNATLWLYVPKYLEKAKFSTLEIRKHLMPNLALFIPQIAIQSYTALDKVMIGLIISNKAEVGYYEQAQKVVKMLTTFLTSLSTVMMPRMANLFSKKDQKRMNNYIDKSFSAIYLLGFPLVFGIIAVADNFVPLFFGAGYGKVTPVMKILSPIVLAIGASNVTGAQYLIPSKRQNQYTISVVASSIVNFTLNMIFIPIYGAFGAAIGSVAAEFTVLFVHFLYTRKELDWKKIIFSAKDFLIASLIMFVTCLGIDVLLDSKFVTIVGQVLIGGAVYCLVLRCLDNKAYNSLKKKFFRRYKVTS